MLLSVIIPVHNSEEFLLNCVESIYEQGLNEFDFELILVNNASEDHSLKLCREIAAVHTNVQVVSTEEAGVSNARNMGLNLASGEYVHFVDADDELMECMYSLYMDILKKSKTDLIISGICNYYETDKSCRIEKADSRQVLKDSIELRAFLERMTPEEKVWTLNVVWNKWYRREVIEKMKCRFDTGLSVGEDFVFNCHFFAGMDNCHILPEACYRYFHRSRFSAVNRFREEVTGRRKRMLEEQLELYRKYDLNHCESRIRILNGELLFKSMYAVFQSDCPFSERDKRIHIHKIMTDPVFQCAIEYLEANRNIYYNSLLWLARGRRYGWFYYILKGKYLVTELFRR